MSEEIKTYPEMNKSIKYILSMSDEFGDQYILARICNTSAEQ
ncbi:hypothetical protein [Lentibacillus sp. Marseille-P4043]|nr:hypothetical protein [Lentibacillus sp. Marseille-P4043]